MKRAMLVVLSLLVTPSLFADATSRLIPAGASVSCTTGDGRISSKTTAIGDPVLCKVQLRRGDFMLPYGSYLGGEFAEYKDPGHLVGKGWMELDFDRLYVGDTVIPINAKVVDVPGYKIDAQGRILGKGHAVRDTVLWMIPVLWPIDLINLPRRGPRPTLKAETTVTLRVMDDIQVPIVPEPQRDPYGLYQRGPQSYAPAPPPPAEAPDQGPENSYVPEQPTAPVEQPAPPAVAYAPPVAYPAAAPYAPPVVAPYCLCTAPYVGVTVAPGIGVYSYGVYSYGVRPYVRNYGYAPRAYAPAVRPYGYGFASRGYIGTGYVARGGYRR
ncbi:MAG TPA: hypothetical protein VMT38_08095 [Terracidiphilus sp.]|nr:hypothetical protein [Terracidiphilus sp.]